MEKNFFELRSIKNLVLNVLIEVQTTTAAAECGRFMARIFYYYNESLIKFSHPLHISHVDDVFPPRKLHRLDSE